MSCCHVNATVLSTDHSVTGEASATLLENAKSMMVGSVSRAAETSASLGMNAMTSFGEESSAVQYPFALSDVIWLRTAWTCCLSSSLRRAASAPVAVAG